MTAHHLLSRAVFAILRLGAGVVQGAPRPRAARRLCHVRDRDSRPRGLRALSLACAVRDDRCPRHCGSRKSRQLISNYHCGPWDRLRLGRTFAVNPAYPSFEMCEAARAELVEDFLHLLKRRYLQPFNLDSKCARSDGDAAV